MPHDDEWTPEEDKLILHLKNRHRASFEAIGRKIQRSGHAVRHRLDKLQGGGAEVVPFSRALLWPVELDQVVIDMRARQGMRYSAIAKWLAAQGYEVPTARVKNGVQFRMSKGQTTRAVREFRDPYGPGHPTTWGALNSLLPNVGPLHYTPGV